MSDTIIHLEAGFRTACASFRRVGGMVGFSRAEYHAVLLGKVDGQRVCKSCYAHYVKRTNMFNRKRTAEGRPLLSIAPLV